MIDPPVRVLIVAVTAERSVEKNEEEVALVTVSCVIDVVAKELLPETVRFVKNELTEKRFVEVALVIIDEEAKMFCEKRLRKRSDEEPRDPPRSEFGVMLPAICSLSVGVVTPIPTLPVDRIVKREVVANPAVVEETENSGRVEPRVP